MPSMSTSLPATALLLSSFLLVLPSHAANAAPAQLLNKTVEIRWNVRYDGHLEGRPTTTATSTVTRTIYVSSQGRLFAKVGVDRGHRSDRPIYAEPTGTKDGLIAQKFVGNQIVGTNAFAVGALRYVISFNPTFTECSVTATMGREGGRMKQRVAGGKIYEVEAVKVSGEGCSIRDGNPFVESSK